MRTTMAVSGVLAFLTLLSWATAAGTDAAAQPQLVAHHDGTIGRLTTRDPAGPAGEFTCTQGRYLLLVGLFWPHDFAPGMVISSGDILGNSGVGSLDSNGAGVWHSR